MLFLLILMVALVSVAVFLSHQEPVAREWTRQTRGVMAGILALEGAFPELAIWEPPNYDCPAVPGRARPLRSLRFTRYVRNGRTELPEWRTPGRARLNLHFAQWV